MTSGIGSDLPQWIFRLAIMKYFFTTVVRKYWNRLPREMIGALNLSVPRRHLYNAFYNTI